MTLKQLAAREGVTYEAVRAMVARHAKALEGHITTVGRAQQLDDYAVQYLTAKRRDHPVVIKSEESTISGEQLKADNNTLKTQLLQAQALIIEMQQTQMQLIEEKARFSGLIEANTSTIQALQQSVADISQAKATAEAQAANDAAAMRKKLEEAQQEAQSYVRTWFGLYRRKK